jgi:hypothetical protein
MSTPTATLYPNGQQLLSSALSPASISAFMLQLTCGVLGINPPDYSQVRDEWQTQGQPFADVGKDICYVACIPTDVDYRLVHDLTYSTVPAQPGVSEKVQEFRTRTRGWRVSWTLYGPNATDRARMIYDAMSLDWVTDSLSLQQLFPIPDFPEPLRVPELINAQWFERADFHCVMYEYVTATILDNTVKSVEVKLYDKDGLESDFTVETTP